MSAYRASILLAARDAAPELLRCLSAVARLPEDGAFEVVVVDDGSADDTERLLAGVDGDFQALREPEAIGWGPAIDRAATAARGEHLVLLREDTVPVDGWLDALLDALDAGAGAARPQTPRADGSRLDGDGWACLAVRRDAFGAVGGVTGASRPGRAERATFLEALRDGGHAVEDVPAAVVLVGA